MGFDNEKGQSIDKMLHFDKSKAGSVDKEIKPLVDRINDLRDFYTNSSCSGRIMVLEAPASGKKFECKWLFVSHDPVSSAEISEAISRSAGKTVWLRMESPIVHITARDIGCAGDMLECANASGFRRAGMISFSRRIVLEVTCPERFNVPLSEKGRIFADDEYIVFLAGKANSMLRRSRKKMDRFYENIKKKYLLP